MKKLHDIIEYNNRFLSRDEMIAKSSTVQARNSSFELLRIFSAVMIIANHLVNHGVLQVSTSNAYLLWMQGNTTNRVACALLTCGGRLGVALFFMISGFFLYDRKELSKHTLSRFLGTVHFYGALLMIAFLVCRAVSGYGLEYNLSTVVKQSLFYPVYLWWFALSYFILLFLSPSINAILNHSFVITLFILFYIWLFFFMPGNSQSIFYNVVKAVFFYLLGCTCSLLKRSEISVRGKLIIRNIVVLFLISFLWILVSFISYQIIKASVGLNSVLPSSVFFISISKIVDCILIPIIAILLISFFSNFYFYNKTINRLSKSTFATYLVHDNPYLRHYLMHHVLKIDNVQYLSNWFPLFIVIDVIVIYCLAFLLETVRNKLIIIMKRE